MGRYVANRAATDDIASALGMKNLMGDVTRRGAQSVRQSSPRRTGAFARSIVTGVVLEPDGWHARIGSDDPFWHLVEFGSANNPTYAPLRRGVERAGIRNVRTTPKGAG